MRGANILGLPVITTEQYPKALGATVPELREVLPASSSIVAKTRFSMLTPEVSELLQQKPLISQVLLCGIEAHVCVLQTTLDLIESGYEVHIITDAVSSQRVGDRTAGLARAAQSGAFLVTSEMALFQLMQVRCTGSDSERRCKGGACRACREFAAALVLVRSS